MPQLMPPWPLWGTIMVAIDSWLFAFCVVFFTCQPMPGNFFEIPLSCSQRATYLLFLLSLPWILTICLLRRFYDLPANARPVNSLKSLFRAAKWQLIFFSCCHYHDIVKNHGQLFPFKYRFASTLVNVGGEALFISDKIVLATRFIEQSRMKYLYTNGLSISLPPRELCTFHRHLPLVIKVIPPVQWLEQ